MPRASRGSSDAMELIVFGVLVLLGAAFVLWLLASVTEEVKGASRRRSQDWILANLSPAGHAVAIRVVHRAKDLARRCDALVERRDQLGGTRRARLIEGADLIRRLPRDLRDADRGGRDVQR